MSEVTTEPAQVTTTAAPEQETTVTPAPVTNTAEAVKTESTSNVEANQASVIDDAAIKPADKIVAPEKYELKLGKNSPLNQADIAKIEATAKAQGLSNEDAQKIVASKEAYHAEFHERQMEAMKSQQKAWVDEIQADKEIGGKAYKESVEIAHRGLNKFADDAFKKVLSESGLGNNPHLIRTFYRIGKTMENDRAVLDGKAGAPAKKASRESKLYPKMHQQEE